MEVFEGVLYEILSGIVLGVMGIRMLRLSVRTGQVPERLLGLSFVVAFVSYMIYDIPVVLGVDSVWSGFFGRCTYAVTVVLFALFTKVVFRARQPWAAALTWSIGMALVFGIGWSSLAGDPEGYLPSKPGFWIDWLGMTVAYSWVSIEAWIAYSSARKRMRLDLCDPVTANRYLLWASFGVLEVVSCIAQVFWYANFEATGVWSESWDFFVSGIEVVALVAVWLVFFSPSWYQNWVQSRGSVSVIRH